MEEKEGGEVVWKQAPDEGCREEVSDEGSLLIGWDTYGDGQDEESANEITRAIVDMIERQHPCRRDGCRSEVTLRKWDFDGFTSWTDRDEQGRRTLTTMRRVSYSFSRRCLPE